MLSVEFSKNKRKKLLEKIKLSF